MRKEIVATTLIHIYNAFITTSITMNLLEKIVSIYAPHSCLGCYEECDRLLCDGCFDSLGTVPPRCYRCKQTTRNYLVCVACRPKTPLRTVVAAVHHAGLAKEMIHIAKYERAKAGFSQMASLMAESIRYFPPDALLVAVPTASSRVRQRGYDQAVELAKLVSNLTGRPTLTALMRLGQAHQVGANRANRIKHLKNAFRPINSGYLSGRSVILIDDVATTGATLESAARTLRAAGAKNIDALVFAQAK